MQELVQQSFLVYTDMCILHKSMPGDGALKVGQFVTPLCSPGWVGQVLDPLWQPQ